MLSSSICRAHRACARDGRVRWAILSRSAVDDLGWTVLVKPCGRIPADSDVGRGTGYTYYCASGGGRAEGCEVICPLFQAYTIPIVSSHQTAATDDQPPSKQSVSRECDLTG